MTVKGTPLMKRVSPTGYDFPADLLGGTPELIARGGADHADVAGHLVIQFVEHAAMLDDVLVHLQRGGPHAHAVPGAETSCHWP